MRADKHKEMLQITICDEQIPLDTLIIMAVYVPVIYEIGLVLLVKVICCSLIQYRFTESAITLSIMLT